MTLTSPHLSRLALCLELYPEALSPENFAAFLKLPFPKLRTLRILSLRPLTLALAAGMKQLLSLPSLEYVQIRCRYGDPSIFQHIWKRLSPTVKGIELKCPGLDSSLPAPTQAHAGAPLKIESLKVRGSRGIVRWLASDRCAFDFSHLRALHLGNNSGLLHAPVFIAAAKTLELLEIDARLGTYAIDLSPYTRLEFLHIFCESDEHLPKVFETLRTIPRRNRIEKVRIFGCSDDGSRWIQQQLAALRTFRRKLEVRGAPDTPVASNSIFGVQFGLSNGIPLPKLGLFRLWFSMYLAFKIYPEFVGLYGNLSQLGQRLSRRPVDP
ncbi:hypothetical protein B0H10DRAFT_2431858 [Mycena sp. CBHHK59/15]|nr:hypothetical protein B0H10DRAFT_2431858 [Mycena sp. CBHHK59/15]